MEQEHHPAELKSRHSMDLPSRPELPMFVYGLLKPGMPAFEQIKRYLASDPVNIKVAGALYVRDGLPLLHRGEGDGVDGYLLTWRPDYAEAACQKICEFEPREHYKWVELPTDGQEECNALLDRFPSKGNPEPVKCNSWRLIDDPAFGVGLNAVNEMLKEVSPPNGDPWRSFFRAQMAYLLLWSIVERLSALCIGPSLDPTLRMKRLHELPNMPEIVAEKVRRDDVVADSRNPNQKYKLNRFDPRNCFKYYYQVRSNLSHRGKGVFRDWEKVYESLREMYDIVSEYLRRLELELASRK